MTNENGSAGHVRVAATLHAHDLSPAAHFQRLILVLLAAVGGFLLVRNALVPESFGRDGHYRATAVDDIVARESRYKGNATCTECHEDDANTLKEEKHQGVPCETCHGPARGHLTNADSRVRLQVDKSRHACLNCHEKISGRPSKFGQIDVEEHQKKQEFDGAYLCLECHDAHNP